jgi:DNA polymerase I
MPVDELNELLYGADATLNVVGVDTDISSCRTLVYIRDGEKVREEEHPFEPYLYIDGREILKQAGIDSEVTELIGDTGLRMLARFGSCGEYDNAVHGVAGYYRAHKNDFLEMPYYEVREFTHQFMVASGVTHYKGMEWGGLRVMCLAARMNVPSEIADAANKEHRVLELGAMLGDTVKTIGGENEAAVLTALVKLIADYDPDVICGHQLYKQLMPFLVARAKSRKVAFTIGRGGRTAIVERYVMPLAERRLEFPRVRAFGRSLLDTWILAQNYDIFRREMDSYELPYIACFLGLRETEREAESLDDALPETADVLGALIPNFFHLSQMLPYSLEDSVIKGNATKINSLLLREYYRQRMAIPYPVEGRSYAGGYTGILATGIIKPVINLDVASLYPSLLLAQGIFPQSDRLGVFEKILRELLKRRLEIKHRLRSVTDKGLHRKLDAQQGTFKIIINSFYGYLGTGRMNFADMNAAERVAQVGQETVKKMADVLIEHGCTLIEIDTDGIYLQPPPEYRSKEGYSKLVELANAHMPEGITVELAGVYDAMLSYKVKNYALLGYDGRVTIKGSGMKSRGLEPFLRAFIEGAIRLMLQGKDEDSLSALYQRYEKKLAEGKFTVRELAKTEILVDSLLTYQKKLETTRRNRQAQYEVALRYPTRYKPGDPVTYYITGETHKVKAYETAKHVADYDPAHPDANIPYYRKRLEETFARVKTFTGEETGSTNEKLFATTNDA